MEISETHDQVSRMKEAAQTGGFTLETDYGL
jgi:hypothetical protein